ncbi:MAG: exodeoxyribonuclease III [Cyclobacteriaceae bacterium]|nr:exodeoxyribonuclease III [Cyclobacteriaceae bacterium]
MRIISYNVNGIRAAINKGLIDWLEDEQPDVVCIQELKAKQDQVDTSKLEEMGYHQFWFPAEKPGYSGVALFSKIAPQHVEYGCGIEKYDVEGRVVRADYNGGSVISVYMPSGTSGDERQAFKMQWLDDFQDYVNSLKKELPNLIICGDYNIAHEEIDIHNPKGNQKNSGFLPEERAWVSSFLESGFTDSYRSLHSEPDRYSWWTYRFNARKNNKGWRIDYQMVSDPLQNKISDADLREFVVHSDHCPTYLDINL